MRQVLLITALVAMVIALSAPHAAAVRGPFHGMSFQWFRDADGDGIPNHLDDDWVPPLDGTGYKMKHGGFATVCGFDLNGPSPDGDRLQDRDQDKDQTRLRDGIYDRIRLRLKDGSCQ